MNTRTMSMVALIFTGMIVSGFSAEKASTIPQEASQKANTFEPIKNFLPKAYTGGLIIFPDDKPPSSENPDVPFWNVEGTFQKEEADAVLKRIVARWEAHVRMYSSFFHKSNLRDYDTEGHNPFTFLDNGAKELPENASILWKLNKKEYIDLNQMSWDSMILGGGNNLNYLQAYIDYTQYTCTRLKIELLEAKGMQASEEYDKLKRERQFFKDAVIKYLQTSPAD